LSLLLARSIAEGSAAGPWKANKAHPVFYIDGEMPLDSVKERDGLLTTKPAPLFFVSHQRVFDKSNLVLNLAWALNAA